MKLFAVLAIVLLTVGTDAGSVGVAEGKNCAEAFHCCGGTCKSAHRLVSATPRRPHLSLLLLLAVRASSVR